jgi:hypothetical protein
MVTLVSMLMLGLGFALTTNSAFEVEIASSHERETLAFYAAQTGMERAIDGFRTSYTTASLPADGAVIFNQTPVSYSGSTVTADYTVSLLRRDSPAGSFIYPYPIHYTISSVGRLVPANSGARPSSVTLTQTVSVSPRSLANYALFYDQFSSTLSFSPWFRLAGRLAVNEAGGVNVSTTTTVNGDFYAAGNINGGPPIVSGNIVENGGQIPFPTTVTPFSSGADASYRFNGTTRMIFMSDGTVSIYNANITGGFKNVPLPANGQIAVTGDLIVEGTVKGRVTATATDDILINGNIRYADQSAGSWDTLALVANDAVVIPKFQYTATYNPTSFEPVWSGTTSITSISGGTFGSNPIPPTGPDLYVDATLVSLTTTSNGVVDPNNRPPGKFHVYGNTIGKRAVQTLRSSGGAHVNGLSLQITENKKLDLLPPPGFPFDNKVLPTFFTFREVRTALQ